MYWTYSAINTTVGPSYPWQSRIEIGYYSIAYFERITKFDVLQRWAFAKGGAHTRFIDVSDIHVFSRRVWALPLAEAQP